MTTSLDLPASPEAAGLARRAVRDLLALANAADTELAEDAALLVSEVVTNAVRHASGPRVGQIRLDARVSGRELRVEVHDPDPAVPRPDDAGLLAERGRGLCLVAALAKEWGSVANDTGKTVWFTLLLP